MAVLPINIREKGRQRLSTVLWIIHWICAVCGLTIISIGLYINIRIQHKVSIKLILISWVLRSPTFTQGSHQSKSDEEMIPLILLPAACHFCDLWRFMHRKCKESESKRF